MKAAYCWLGVAGLALHLDGHNLWIDPFFSRPSLLAVASGQARRANPQRVERAMRSLETWSGAGCDHVLITHAHYDHMLDVPEIMRISGAPASGSANAVALLRLLGQPDNQLDALTVGDQRQIGPWTVRVLAGWHVATPLDWRINGPLRPNLGAPPYLLDYRMDACFSYLLEGAGLRLLVGFAAAPAPLDLAFITPYLPKSLLRQLIHQSQPRRLALIHWDDFWRPLDNPVPRMPVVTRRLATLTRAAQHLNADCQVRIPEPFQPYPLD